MKNNICTDFIGINLKTPLLTASGTFGYGDELTDLADLNKIGAIITKTITFEARQGNPQPRIAEVSSGMLNTIGLQNVGVHKFVEDKLENVLKLKVPVIVSVAGACTDDYVKTVKILNAFNKISAVELNLSCPNLKKTIISQDINLFAGIIRKVKKISKFPVIAKLSPQVQDIALLSQTAQDCGAAAVTLTNTFPAMAIDIDTFKPKLSTVKGGMSGPCVKPMALRCVYDAYQKIKIPIIGCGGICNGNDVIEFLLAGARCVSMGTAALVDPDVFESTAKELQEYLKNKKISNIKDLIGKVKL
ncbi:MAG: dihydroorotate dehydrogenase [Endomicrobiaceae bacterium]